MTGARLREVWESLANRNMAVILFLNLSSGLPIALSTSTLQAWLATTSVDIQTVAWFSLVGLPYTFKFIWAPVMDRFVPPFLGRRRGWILLTQILLILLIAKMAFTVPDQQLVLMGVLALTLAFVSASQDIAINAYQADLLPARERGLGAAVAVSGYRAAMLISGGLAWIIADYAGWEFTYCLMAALIGITIVATVRGPEPEGTIHGRQLSLQQAVYLPFSEFLTRKHGVLLLIFIVLYKLGDASAISLNSLFFIREQGFTLTETGVLYKWLGIVATIIGAFIGGSFIVTHGLYRPLLWFGIAQAITNLGFMLLAITGKTYAGMVLVVAIDQLVGGMGTAVFLAFLMALCDHRYTATQFALLSALASIARVFIGPPAGYLIDTIGWAAFFLVTFLIALPSLVMLYYMRDLIDSYHRVEPQA